MAAIASPRTLAALIAVLGATHLGACADLRRATALPPVNPESPVAAEVAAAARRDFATPSFADVPPTPRNVPQATAIKQGVVSMIRCRQAFERWKGDHPAMVADSSGFAEDLRGRAQANPVDVPAEGDAARSEAFAAGLRASAAPPLPIASGPPPSVSDAAEPAQIEKRPTSSRPRADGAVRSSASVAASPPRSSPPPMQVAEARPFASAEDGGPVPPPPAPSPGRTDALLNQCQ